MVARWLRLSQACPQGTVLSDAEEPAADISPALCARHACHPPRARHGGTPVCSIRLQGSRPAIALAPVRCRMESLLGSYEEGGGSQERPGLGAAPARGGRAGPK
jgi:hypothetical protein